MHKEGDTFVLDVPELERIAGKAGVTGAEIRWQLRGQLARLGVDKALGKAGVRPGDKVRCGNLEWDW